MARWEKKIIMDEQLAEELYMAGLPDTEIAKRLNVNAQYIRDWRVENKEWESNVGVFSWQSSLKPSELAKIPVKYWHP
jgi:uncharacterized protein YjcR